MAPRTREPAATKAGILAAARLQFGQNGFEQTTIRSVASAAGVDPAPVMHYFGNKDGLFGAVSRLDLSPPDLSGVAPEDGADVVLPLFVEVWGPDGRSCRCHVRRHRANRRPMPSSTSSPGRSRLLWQARRSTGLPSEPPSSARTCWVSPSRATSSASDRLSTWTIEPRVVAQTRSDALPDRSGTLEDLLPEIVIRDNALLLCGCVHVQSSQRGMKEPTHVAVRP